jgi:hypothetical protein
MLWRIDRRTTILVDFNTVQLKKVTVRGTCCFHLHGQAINPEEAGGKQSGGVTFLKNVVLFPKYSVSQSKRPLSEITTMRTSDPTTVLYFTNLQGEVHF